MNDLPPGWITTNLDSVVDILDSQRVPSIKLNALNVTARFPTMVPQDKLAG